MCDPYIFEPLYAFWGRELGTEVLDLPTLSCKSVYQTGEISLRGLPSLVSQPTRPIEVQTHPVL